MAKKVNGIKIYPKYSVGSIISAVLCIASGLGIVFGTILFPAFSITTNEGVIFANSFDFLVAGVKGLGISGLDFLDQIAGFTHLINGENFNTDKFISTIDSIALYKSENIAVSWFSTQISSYVLVAAAGGALVSILFALFLILKGIIHLIFGTYPSGSKCLCIFAFAFMFIFVIATFVLTFVSKFKFPEMIESMPDVELVELPYCWAPYAGWGVCLVSFVTQSWIKTLMIKDKLYIPGARKIKKSREIDN